MSELPSIAELAGALERHVISPVELVDDYLKRIEQQDRILHCFTHLMPDDARAEARAAEAEMIHGRYRGPLHGIPVAVKDLIDVVGVPTTAASRAWADRPAVRDAKVIADLREAGAILLGKLDLYEFAIGRPHPTDRYPSSRNPRDPTRVAGGSSSGSAAAVGADFCAAALGTDTGGSIRNPAAYCGVVGMKPTHGLLSSTGVIPLAPSLDCVGPLARTVDDVALFLREIVDARDDISWRPAPDIRIGVPREYISGVEGAEADVLAAFEEALAALAREGLRIVDVAVPARVQVEAVLRTVLLSEAARVHGKLLRARPEAYGEGLRAAILPALAYSAADLARAHRDRAAIELAVRSVFADVDVIATPTIAWTAPRVEAFQRGSLAYTAPPFTGLFNLTGGPSLSMPCGTDRNGLPIGLMLSGPVHADALVVGVGQIYEKVSSWADSMSNACV